MSDKKIVKFAKLRADEILGACESMDYVGYCVECGAEAYGCEPDMRNGKCEECGKSAVYGAEELLLYVAW